MLLLTRQGVHTIVDFRSSNATRALVLSEMDGALRFVEAVGAFPSTTDTAQDIAWRAKRELQAKLNVVL